MWVFPNILQVPQFPPSVALYEKVQDEQAGMAVPDTRPLSDETKPLREADTVAVDEAPLPNPDAVSPLPEREILPEFTLKV
jgi:hypothetical protein